LFVVIWENPNAIGGGHQVVMDWHQANRLRHRISRERPKADVRIEAAEQHSAAAVQERLQRRRPDRSILDKWGRSPIGQGARQARR
jgi:hypothetical protein